ncbi:MAG: hypothetical protein A2651_02585 [Candidatus Yanofskybacteria bacterium RIFCSPHIGHO2_01_FULL_42_12]|uniref:Uncharacterized protein n=1 Tax=Candidatus Yanofskybacteria bacterium RIFCSPLOWO2_01_FULL_42_49 TaxID=1802694 RepID=A0A1F8GBG1_9BACT|nr:MAG: hypothetical protein A2651_02585 [Candidatus Yanofskybacteria bacterium RIFCSPHIGHO2_01_FULL_42_12]OGN22722.1 MAG: hypothetical protein A2918_01225 [Candidatus Yanofskybacteria bacterium RIFCSPLOWO2_01_FULL_42_49]
MLSQEAIDEFKEIYKDTKGEELTDAQASEAANNLVNFFSLLYKLEIKDRQRKERLKKEPDGFILPNDGYTCGICHQYNQGEKWYHWYGIACTVCRKAVANGVIPAFVGQHRESWYSTWQLTDKFGIKSPTARKLVRQGQLKARVILTEDGKPYEYIYLKKENPELIDPGRHSPARKSYDRNRNKVLDMKIREEKKKFRAERDKIKKRLSKKV